MNWAASTAIVPLALLAMAGAARAESCEDLAKAAPPGAAITAAKAVAAGDLQEIGGFGAPPLPTPVAYCRIDAVLTPTPSSQIQVEVWLPPKDAWNGKFLGAGNGGFGGTLGGPRLEMRVAVHRGYATAGTDMGHAEDGASGASASWALNQPEKIADFGYRANHLTAQFAKAMIRAYYGTDAAHAYFQGCSDGGREALMEAQRFPDDYDGIIAGAPANAWSHLMTAFAYDWNAAHDASGQIVPDAKLAVVEAAALADCDAQDGVKDGVIADPGQCRFDVARLACKGADAPDCLTPAEVEAVKAIWRGPHDAAGHALFPGFPVGTDPSPAGWPLWITGAKAQQGGFARSFFADFVYSDADWKVEAIDPPAALAKARAGAGAEIDSDSPDLSAFKARGGKLILYHGWLDSAITPLSTIQYYEAVRARMSPAGADSFSRLFLVPGMGHCLGGPGANSFDVISLLEAWTEKGQAPEQMVAYKYDNDLAGFLDMPPGTPIRSRPLCAYPKTAHWTGTGSSDDAANWRCEAAKP